MIKIAVRMAVLQALARARRTAGDIRPERLATHWAFRLGRMHVPF